jgi:hypothetical protein
MKLNRNGLALGLVVGVLAGGAGGVLAATGGPSALTSSARVHGIGMNVTNMGGTCGMAFGQNSLAAAASYLGLTQADLRTQLQAGKSLADVANVQGKSVTGLEDAIVASVTTGLDASTTYTATQKAAILAQVKSHLDAIVTATYPFGMGIGVTGHMGAGGMMGGGMMGGAWR